MFLNIYKLKIARPNLTQIDIHHILTTEKMR